MSGPLGGIFFDSHCIYSTAVQTIELQLQRHVACGQQFDLLLVEEQAELLRPCLIS